jgi:mannose-6-phosphate isomerase
VVGDLPRITHVEPLVFEPYLRPQIWGDRRLESLFGKTLPCRGTFGESWEVSGHPHHVSRVAEGPLEGSLLTHLCANHCAELFGAKMPAEPQFPLLVKLLDCQDRLSLQVHPDDDLARKLLGERNGKTEAWVVMDAAPTARVYAGLLPGTTRADLERRLADKTVEECLYSFTPKCGDCIFFAAGTVHAAGGGVVVAEVQQSSDATFRLFDWNRIGSDGRPRQLHLDEALASINWKTGPVRPARSKESGVRGQGSGVVVEHLVRCQYFHMDLFRVERSLANPFASQMSIWLVLAGAAELHNATGGYSRVFQRGETVVVPACAEGLTWLAVRPSLSVPLAGEERGDATLLGIHLP